MSFLCGNEEREIEAMLLFVHQRLKLKQCLEHLKSIFLLRLLTEFTLFIFLKHSPERSIDYFHISCVFKHKWSLSSVQDAWRKGAEDVVFCVFLKFPPPNHLQQD